ncbi:hypothetical protein F5X98DRAFT_359373 [Xylaria grammica]|nr:hypothetical protein F5X98DRAFT_359373 [Xylaria grammica]
MASLRLPHFRIDPSQPPHQPFLGQDPTQAASSLQAGTFQYVDSDFLNDAASVLTSVSASAVDPVTGRAYFLCRTDPQLVVLDRNGKIVVRVTDPDLKTGHSIKLIDAGKGFQPWVADMGSSTIRVYNANGNFMFAIGPEINGSTFWARGNAATASKEGPTITLGKVTDIAFDAVASQFYITDGGAGGPYNRVVVLNQDYRCIAVWSGDIGATMKNTFNIPHAIAVDPWSRVWVVDSQNHRILVMDRNGVTLNSWKFPGVVLYGISISTARAVDENQAMVYLTGNTPDRSPETGTIMLLTTTFDLKNPGEIGTDVPLTIWDKQPSTMLHWICSGAINGEDTILLSDLPGRTNLQVDGPPAASAYKLAPRRPLFQVPQVPPSPLWPGSFHAVALLHPFNKDNQSFCVAEIWYTESAYIRCDMYTPSGISVSFVYESEGGKTHFRISINKGPYSSPFPTTRTIPERSWIAKKGKFQGQLPILDVQTNWWYTVAEEQTTMWHWFRSDNNTPWRTMNSIDSNPDNIAVLQDFAFINWPTFSPTGPRSGLPENTLPGPSELPQSVLRVASHDDASVAQILGHLVLLDKKGLLGTTDEQRTVNLAYLSRLVPGLSPGSGGLPVPRWPERFFMTCTMTAINDPSPMSTEVLYDWTSQLQRTRMFNWDQESCIDAVLTTDPPNSPSPLHVPGTTYILERNVDGTVKCGSPIPDIGPPPPDWAAQNSADIVATIKDNPQLSPNATTRIFHCPFDKTTQSQFWIWYSNRYGEDTPVVFMQTLPPQSVGTNLALADYQRMNTTALVDPVSYSVPVPCKKKAMHH